VFFYLHRSLTLINVPVAYLVLSLDLLRIPAFAYDIGFVIEPLPWGLGGRPLSPPGHGPGGLIFGSTINPQQMMLYIYKCILGKCASGDFHQGHLSCHQFYDVALVLAIRRAAPSSFRQIISLWYTRDVALEEIVAPVPAAPSAGPTRCSGVCVVS